MASYSLADLDAVAVDVEHEFEGVGRIEEADHVNKILEVGASASAMIARWQTARSNRSPH
ncbi:hypothetical protein GWE18_00950 [Bradyrhizobium sp. CSA112]|uniref:hypothetical protein n=1 Tax=Bradyrhizobium sp. CSA112 TaxID=2699170 RepID=UPI0023B05770|nr:hypothetical protein [Bradyrhizobium sp. CSA112]MDE5451442.1 hypothetical protein [Bradyrhizobium sp. CSA112]